MEEIWVQWDTVGSSACQLCFHSVLIPSFHPVLGQPELPVSNKMKTVCCVCTLLQIGTDVTEVNPALQEIPQTSIKWEAAWFTTGMTYSLRCLLLPVNWRCVSWRILRSCLRSLSRFVAGRGHVWHTFTFHLQISPALIFRQVILFFRSLSFLIWKMSSVIPSSHTC